MSSIGETQPRIAIVADRRTAIDFSERQLTPAPGDSISSAGILLLRALWGCTVTRLHLLVSVLWRQL